jgi:hypothetical protein
MNGWDGGWQWDACQQEVLREECPEECRPFMQADIHRPYSTKHGLQQASLLSNMRDFGLIQVGLFQNDAS